MTAINPFDFFLENDAETVSVHLRADPGRASWSRTWKPRRPGRACWPWSMRCAAASIAHDRLPGRAQPATAEASPLPHPHGAGRADVRGDADAGQRLVPRLGLAAGAAPAPPRPGRALRLRLPDPAHAPTCKSLDGPSGPEHDFTDLHAWAEVYLPGAGWIGLDPTSGLLAGEGHIPLACAADPTSAAPITGSYSLDQGPGPRRGRRVRRASSTSQMSVTRIHEDAARHQAVHRGAVAGDRRPGRARRRGAARRRRAPDDGRRADLRLDRRPRRRRVEHRPPSGRHKRRPGRRAAAAAARPLRAGRPAALRPGQWYPGESLPRWAFGCYWRRDGVPVWDDPTLVADDGPRLRLRLATTRSASSRRWPSRLGVDPESCRARPTKTPGITCGASGGCRSTSIRSKSRLDDAEERRRLARVFEQGLGEVVGYALPLRPPVATPTAALGERPLVPAPRAPVPDPRRFADGLSPAARLAALGAARSSATRCCQLDPFAPRGPLPPRRPADVIADRRSRCEARGHCTAFGAQPSPPALRRPARRRPCDPHRPLRRAARRPAARLPAAADARWKIISTWSPPSKRRPPSCSMPVLIEGYPPPHDPPPRAISRSRPTPA